MQHCELIPFSGCVYTKYFQMLIANTKSKTVSCKSINRIDLLILANFTRRKGDICTAVTIPAVYFNGNNHVLLKGPLNVVCNYHSCM